MCLVFSRQKGGIVQIEIEQAKVIGDTIRSVAKAQAERYYKSEHNTTERASLVFIAIEAQVRVALLDAGIPFEVCARYIDPTDEIEAAMAAVGFDMLGIGEDEDLLGPDAGEGYDEVFGPVPHEDCFTC